MSARGHTPGPWTVNKSGKQPIVGKELNDGQPALPLVTAVHGYNATQARANARLIAAAPDLLFALQCCIGSLAVVSPGGNQDPDVLRAKAAVAKALGKSAQ